MYWLAEIESEAELAGRMFCRLTNTLCKLSDQLAVAPAGMRMVRIGHRIWDGASPSDKLLCVSSALAAAATFDVDDPATLTFTFSDCQVPSAVAKGLLESWVETGEPPVLSIVKLQLGNQDAGHLTHGLTAFAGLELAAEFHDEQHSQDAARDLARLARYVLMTGAIDTRKEFIGVNGTLEILEPHDPPPRGGYWMRLRSVQTSH
jgi:hypothetical protein